MTFPPSMSGQPDFGGRVQAFKSFLAQFNEVETLVFSHVSKVCEFVNKKDSGDAHEGEGQGKYSFRTNHFHAARGAHSFFAREIDSPSMYLDKTERSFDSSMNFVGRYDELSYRVDQGLILEEAPGEFPKANVIAFEAAFFCQIVDACLNLGIWGLDRASVRWQENQMCFDLSVGEVPNVQRSPGRSSRLIAELNGDLWMDLEGALRIEYSYQDPDPTGIGVPCKIVGKENSGELSYGFEIHKLVLAKSPLPESHFKPDSYVNLSTHARAQPHEKRRYLMQRGYTRG